MYQATLSADKSPDGKEHGAAKYAKATKKLGHDWGDATYEWSADNSTVTATHVCKRDPSHVGTETVKTEITKTTKEPTCKEPGIGDVKTKDFWDSAFQEQTKTNATIPVDSDAHDWEEVGKQDNPNECGGYVTEFKCKLCDKEKEEGSVTYRHFGCKSQHNVKLEEFIKLLKDEIESKALPQYEEQQN